MKYWNFPVMWFFVSTDELLSAEAEERQRGIFLWITINNGTFNGCIIWLLRCNLSLVWKAQEENEFSCEALHRCDLADALTDFVLSGVIETTSIFQYSHYCRHSEGKSRLLHFQENSTRYSYKLEGLINSWSNYDYRNFPTQQVKSN